MIYLSGAMAADKIGLRKDVGIMTSFRPKGDRWGKTARFDCCLWAADNGCFTNPDLKIGDYLKWLKNLSKFKKTCLFAVAPDVVGDAKSTWEKSAPVLPQIRDLGYAAAFVAQDGVDEVTIHWDAFDCLFIGGSTEFKLNSFWLCREAIKQGKWVHMGRVNSMRRILIARFAGCHSTDGTMLAFAPDKYYEDVQKWLDFIHTQPTLNF